MNYDSTKDTLEHIERVSHYLTEIILELIDRKQKHDISKLHSPEKEMFDIFTPKLKNSIYGSEEYKTFLEEMKGVLTHHYKVNPHHPEYHEKGIDGMSLVDLIEMICDWKASSERHVTGNINKSIIINKNRFNISEQLANILQNTINKNLNQKHDMPTL